MATLIPWGRKKDETEPAAPLARLRGEIDTLFDRMLRDPLRAMSDWPASVAAMTPATDLAETESHVVITMDLPGVDMKDVQIDVAGGALTVRGEKKHELDESKTDHHYVERYYGSFMRSVQLPSTVDLDKVEATHQNGVLTIKLAKRADAKPKRIAVREA